MAQTPYLPVAPGAGGASLTYLYDAVNIGPYAILSGDKETATATNDGAIYSDARTENGYSTGKHCAEIRVLSAPVGPVGYNIGIVAGSVDLTTNYLLGNNAASYSYFVYSTGAGGYSYHGSYVGGYAPYAQYDYIDIACNYDAGTAAFYKNGILQFTFAGLAPGVEWHICVGVYSTTASFTYQYEYNGNVATQVYPVAGYGNY